MKEKWKFLLLFIPLLGMAHDRFPLMTVSIEEDHILEREMVSIGRVDIDAATTIAINAFLENRDDLEAPLFVAKNALCALNNTACGDGPEDLLLAQVYLGHELNKVETTLSLAPLTDKKGRVFNPQFWIFTLAIPSISSDHLFFAVIDREGMITPHVYGVH